MCKGVIVSAINQAPKMPSPSGIYRKDSGRYEAWIGKTLLGRYEDFTSAFDAILVERGHPAGKTAQMENDESAEKPVKQKKRYKRRKEKSE